MKNSFFFILLSCLALSCFVSGCNTVRGLGEDLSGSSRFVERKMMGGGSSDDSSSINPPQWPK